MSTPVTSIRIDALDPEAAALWRSVARIAAALGDGPSWCLVGGLMVALFAIEAGQTARPTTDIDILGDARTRPSATEHLAATLEELGGELADVSGPDLERGFRFILDGQIVDVLAPDGLPDRRPPLTSAPLQTIQIPGGTQALQRTEVIELIVNDQSVHLRRPSLIAAILLKARSLPIHHRPDDQRHDLITLLGLIDDPRTARESITPKEIAWLRAIDARLRLEAADLDDLVGPERAQHARAAFQLLTR